MRDDFLKDLEKFFEQIQDLLMGAAKDVDETADEDSSSKSSRNSWAARIIQYGVLGKILLATLFFAQRIVLKYINMMLEKAKFEANLFKRVIVYFAVFLIFLATAWLYFFLFISAVFFDNGYSMSVSLLISFAIQFLIALIMLFLIRQAYEQSFLSRTKDWKPSDPEN